MNTDTLDPDRAEVITLLQPFVDGELDEREHELVARQIAKNPEYQAFVREQQEVRAVLRELTLEPAPPGLRERVLAQLDAIEAEERRGWLAPILGRIGAFGRGALLMVPAVAAAAVLFVVAGNAGWLDAGPSVDGVHVDGGMAHSLPVPKAHTEPAPTPDPGLPDAEQLAENLGFSVQVAPSQTLPRDVELVSDSERAPGSSAMVRYRDADGALVVDRQRRAGVVELRGVARTFQARTYHLGRDAQGRPWVEFQLGEVHHNLALEGAPARIDGPIEVEQPDFANLLEVADALWRAHGQH